MLIRLNNLLLLWSVKDRCLIYKSPFEFANVSKLFYRPCLDISSGKSMFFEPCQEGTRILCNMF